EVLQALEVDFIDESEVLTPADEENHIWKHDYRVPFVCGARNLGEALRRIAEGAAMIRTKGEAGSGNVVEAVRHMRAIISQMKKLTTMRDDELMREAKELGAPLEIVRQIAKTGKLPVPNFSAGGIATPADAALVRRLGAEAVFVGSGIFKSSDPETRAKAVVKATTHFEDPKIVLEAHEELGEAMKGEHDTATIFAGRRFGRRDCEICAAGRRHLWDLRRGHTAGYRSAESQTGFAETSGYDRAAERVRPADRQRRGQRPDESQEG